MNRLITIPFSHYCEKARWALEYAGVPFQEEGHVPIFHWRASYGVGGGRTVPVLTTDEGVLRDSTDILHFADRAAPANRKLYGSPEVEALEDLFDKKLGPATRRVAYYFMMPHPEMMRPIFGRSVPRLEAGLISLFFPLVVKVIKRGLKIDEAGAQKSIARVHEIFATVGERLKDGRRFLDGESFSAADLTFASLAAPVIFPEQHPVTFREVSALPPEVRGLVTELRESPAGKFARRMYAEERRPHHA